MAAVAIETMKLRILNKKLKDCFNNKTEYNPLDTNVPRGFLYIN